jgi:6-phosphogluconolactonase (cycloisomerase 2 family)
MKILFRFLIILFCLFNNKCYSANETLGSDSTTSQAIAYSLLNGSENRIANYALMANGFGLQDSSTTCSFDSVYSTSRLILTSGGKLFLNKDLILDSKYPFPAGAQVFGNHHYIFLKKLGSDLEFLNGSFGGLQELDNYDMGNIVYTVDWSYDDKYVSAGKNNGGLDDLRVFEFDGQNLTSVFSLDFTNHVNSVRWHPTGYFLAVGLQSISGADLFIYSWDPETTSLTLLSSFDIAGNVWAVDWSANGSYLAVGRSNGLVRIYSFDGTVVSFVTELNLTGPNITLQKNALSWNYEGTLLAVGLSQRPQPRQRLRVLSFDGSSLTQVAAVDPGANLLAADWRPDSNIIAIGLSGSSPRTKIYEYTNGTLVDITPSNLAEPSNCYSVHWSSDGNYLSVGRLNGAGVTLRNYYFDQDTNSIFLYAQINPLVRAESVRWSHNQKYVAMGNRNDVVYIYGFNQTDLEFFDTNLILSDDLKISTTVTFFNESSIYGNGSSLDFLDSGFLRVGESSTLKLSNLELRGLRESNLSCLSDDSYLILENCNLNLLDDYVFEKGQILFNKDVNVLGASQFTFAGSLPLVINKNSQLSFSKGITFNYYPAVNDRDLIFMYDKSSNLFLDEMQLNSANKGLRFSRGTLFFDNLVTLNSAGTTPFDSISFVLDDSDESVDLNLLAGANLKVFGYFYLGDIGILYKSFFEEESLDEWTPDPLFGNIDRWAISGDEMQNVSGSGMTIIFRGDVSWFNYTLIALVRRVSSTPMGIIFYYNDQNNYWRYLNESGRMLIRGRVGGSWKNAGGLGNNSFPVDDTVNNQWYWYKAKVDNGFISTKHWLLNTDEPLDWEFSVYDNSLLGGRIGLMGWHSSPRFKDVLAYLNN